jgi:3'(2'), 5'-bisphosphate nucleotidase
LSEEGEKLEGDIKTFWCVDPLDGTKEFIKRNGEFTVNIALIADHLPVLGVVHIPVANETFMGMKGNGAKK